MLRFAPVCYTTHSKFPVLLESDRFVIIGLPQRFAQNHAWTNSQV